MIDTLDLACVELQAISDDIVSGCKAYHNARVVVRYYNRYGYTEHFRELIGEENLVDQAKEVIRKFIRWIKQKLSELIDKVSSILREIKDKLAHMLGLKKTPDDLDSIVKQIDRRFDRSLTRRRETIAITFDTVRILSVTRSAALFVWTGASKHSIDVYTQKVIRHLESVSAACKETAIHEANSDGVRDDAVRVAAVVGNLASVADTFRMELGVLKQTLSDDMTREEFMSAIEQFVKCSPDSFNKSLFDQEIDKVVTDLTSIVSTMVRGSGKLVNITYGYLSKLNKEFNTDALVKVTVKINPMMLRRLEKQFEGSLDVRNIVITNEAPETWNVVNETPNNLPACGWCHGGYGRSAALDLYVNYRLYKKQLLSGEYHEFLLTIVHECRHLFNSQQGLKYESDQAEEDTADTAEDAYVVQPDDISWAKDVVKKIKEQENA